MNFMELMKNELDTRKTFTTNGAVAYETSGKKLLDFNFGLSAMRTMEPDEIMDQFMSVYFEDKLTALEYLFYIGDIREGVGERNTFRCCLLYLVRNHPEIANAVAELIPYYNRWDSIMVLFGSDSTWKTAVEIIRTQLIVDLERMMDGAPISLCAKWMPSINASSKVTRNLANLLCRKLGWTQKEYRKALSKLRKYLDVVEVKMSAKEWGEIDYEKVPSKANLIYNAAFLRNDEERRRKFLASLSKGEAKINAKTLQPHEIVQQYRYKPFDTTLEELWKALPNLTAENTLVVRDGSGSMGWGGYGSSARPIDVATALAIYMSEHNTGVWKDKFLTFSSKPKLVDLHNCKNLRNKIMVSYKENECSNTDIYKTMMLILDTARKNRLKQEDMPGMIVICSDMQFDGTMFNLNKTLFEEIIEEFEEAGYKLPKICFWNLSAAMNGTIPLQQNDLGLILCSGFSVQLMKMFMSNEVDPYKVLLDTLHSERYDKVREAVKDLV